MANATIKCHFSGIVFFGAYLLCFQEFSFFKTFCFDIMNLGLNWKWFVYHYFPWFARGAVETCYGAGINVGVFLFARSYGHTTANDSFRVVR